MRHRQRGLFASRGAPSPRGVNSLSEKKDARALEEEALESIQTCYKYAFVAGIVGVFSILMEGDPFIEGWDLGLAANLCVGRHQFVFGVGLYRVCRITRMLASDASSVTPESIHDIMRTMSSLWRRMAGVVALGSMALSASLPQSRTWIIVLGIAVVGIIPISISARRANKQAERIGKPAKQEYAIARTIGFTGAHNMRLCMGAFALLGSVQIVASLSQTSKIATGLGLVDVAESVAIVRLLSALNRDSLQAVVTVTDGTELKGGDFVCLYVSEKGFYDKLGDVFQSQALAKIIPYIFAATKGIVHAVKG